MTKIFLFLILPFFVSNAISQSVEFSTNVSEKQININETVNVTYNINKSGKIIDPKLSDFVIIEGPLISKSSSISNINGKITEVILNSFTYILKPKKIGKLKIEGAKINIGKNQYTFKTEYVIATDSKLSQKSNKQKNRNLLEEIEKLFEESQQDFEEIYENRSFNKKKDIFVKMISNKNQAYIGEAIKIDFYLYTNSALQVTNQVFPKFNNFIAKDLFVAKSLDESNEEIETVNGIRFHKYLLSSKILFPQKEGVINIEALKLDVKTGSFDNSKLYQSNQLIITVKELPEKDIQLVGTFNSKAVINNYNIDADHNAELSIELEGSGNHNIWNDIELNIDEKIDRLKPEINDNLKLIDNGYIGKKSIKFLLLANGNGKSIVKINKIKYFDPEVQEIKYLEFKDIVLNVSKQIENNKVLDKNYSSKSIFENRNYLLIIYIIILVGLSVLIYYLVIIYNKSKDINEINKENTKKNAYKNFELNINSSSSSKEIISAIYLYFIQKFEIKNTELDKKNLIEILQRNNINNEDSTELINKIEYLEILSYSDENNYKVDDLQKESIKIIISTIEKY